MVKAKHPKSEKTGKRGRWFFKSNSNRPKPVFIFVGLVIFAAIAARLLIAAFAASDSLYMVGSAGTVNAGSTFTVTIHESSAENIDLVHADLTYDQTKLQYVSMTAAGTNFANGLPGSGNTGGNGAVSFVSGISPAVIGDKTVVVVTFKALTTGSTTISFANSSLLLTATDPQVSVPIITTPSTFTLNDTAAPNAPTGLTAGTKTVTTLALSWTAPTDNVGVTGYKVFRNGTQVNPNVTATNFTDTGLTPNTSYSYTVLAFDAAGNPSAQSSALAMSTLADTSPPPIPTGLTAGTKTMTSVTFTWGASLDNVATTNYKIFRDGSATALVTLGNVTTYTDSSLASNTTHTYTVAAVDGAGNNSLQSSSLSMTTLADTSPPTTPGNFTSPSQTTTTIALSWTTSTDDVAVAGYKIFRDGSATALITLSASTLTYNDTGLTQGSTHSYTIWAFDAAGNNSQLSTPASATTKIKAGDITGDGIVNGSDYTVIFSNFGNCTNMTFAQGNIDNTHDNGCVNDYDLGLLAFYFGT